MTGSGAPSGAHYNLNIIGVSKNKTADMTGGDGHRIFVPLNGSTQISLAPGDFSVLDANGTDGSASFQLPNPDPNNDGITHCSVYAYVYADIDGDGTVERLSLFDDRLENYYWQYDNNGLRIVQLRFYQESTNVN